MRLPKEPQGKEALVFTALEADGSHISGEEKHTYSRTGASHSGEYEDGYLLGCSDV